MKRIIILTLVFLMIAALVVSCGQAPAPTEAPPVPTKPPPTAPPTAVSETPTETPLPKSKVIFFINGALDDKVYFDPIYQGISQAQKDLGFESALFEAGFNLGDYTPILDKTAAEADYDIMVLAGQDMGNALKAIAPKYPARKFVLLDGSVEGLGNVSPITLKIDEGSYLAGLYAGLMTQDTTLTGINEEKMVGVIGGMDMPMINAYVNAFKAGAIAAGIPEEGVLIGYANDFGDPAKGKQAALPLYSAGADIVYQVAGGAGMGVFEAAQESGAYAIGVDYDQAVRFEVDNPGLAKVILTSVVKDLHGAAYKAISMSIEGNLEFGKPVSWGLAEGVVGLAKNKYYDEYTPEEVKVKIDQAEKDLQSGALVVPVN